MDVWMGIADSAARTRTVRPASFNSLPFQLGMRVAILSISGCSSTLFSQQDAQVAAREGVNPTRQD